VSARLPKTTKYFRRQYAKMQRSGKKLSKLDEVMAALVRGEILPAKFRDHALQGELRRRRDCHIEGDWILLYELGEDDEGNGTITFHAPDNHENLFG
jgi:mRNA interferase YafQ